ncbi:MAG: protein tyrosine kinase modulator [Blastocatellia bacterium]|jgi:polysaccharide chain length determinant protein (PEP-CTERM system associated)|nr:protein tyrosine kinase modulator [Blastocatellia bacterium]
MSVEFRQRRIGEYAQIAWKRKWLIILPTIAITLAIGIVVFKLPNVYESVTLIVVKPSTLPNSVVPTVTDETLTRELTGITQVVTSRSSLQPLLEKYDLYKTEKLRGDPMEILIDRMRRDIHVEVNTSRNDITNGFNITYRGRDPKTTQAVTAELAGKYINEQTKGTINAGTSAKQFIEQQVNQAKEELDAIDRTRLDWLQKNISNLPSQSQALVGRLSGLHEEQKARIAEIGRLRDLSAAYRTQLGDLAKQYDQEIMQVAENTTDPKTTLAWAELTRRKSDLEAELQNLLTQYKAKHPDVTSKQMQIESVKREQDLLITEWKERIEEKKERLSRLSDPRVTTLKTNLGLVDADITRQQSMLNATTAQIIELDHRINEIPTAEVGLEALDREYQTKKLNYDQLLAQQQKISIGAEAASQQQGEGIQVVDPANLPERPVAPNRMKMIGAALGVGLAIGFLLAALIEVPRLFTIQTTDDAKHYTGLPVLIAIPELLTAQEARAIPRRHKLVMAAGIAATVVCIPAVALILNLTHVFELYLL